MKTKLIPITSLDQLDVGMIIEAFWGHKAEILAKTGQLVAIFDAAGGGVKWLTDFGLKQYALVTDEPQVTDEPWKPKEGEKYYFPFFGEGQVDADWRNFEDTYIDRNCLAAGMCFKTEAEALAAAQKMLDAIKPNQL